uniref:Crystaline entomocidal protoxin n=1 Tax=Bacillus sp. enrichment culture clone BGSN1 TaxID=1295391 RepID=S4TWP4_9BACI|nr:Cry9Aa5 [Bacillus sp. enrichment culture clone BGSN1]
MNQNKHGIIGASNCGCASDDVAKYPLANNPCSSALNLNSCQNSSILNWINIIGDAAKEAVSIGTTIVSLITAPSLTGLISIVYDLIGKVLGGSSGQSISDLSICDLLSIIDLRVSQSVLNDGIADFNGSVLLYGNYLEALDSWNKNPNSASAEELRTRFRIADSEFDRILTRGPLTNGGSLARQNAQILLLPSFASAAFFHLLLLRDATRYGTNWGLYNATPFINYQSKLVGLIELYTDYCVHWYNRGFNELRQRGTSATAWLEFHRYRREMTLMVLDIVASFSSLDITNYPIETDFQLSRVIYTDPIGFVHRSSLRGESWFSFVNRANFSDLENAIPNPRPSWFLNNMIISTGSLTLPVSPSTDRARVWYGSRDRISPANSQFITELISGQHTTATQTILGRNIFRVDSQACNLNDTTYGVNRAVFYHDASEGSQRSVYEGYIRTTGIDNPRVQNINTYLPGENSDIPTPEDYTHILSTTINLTGGLRQVASNRRSSLVMYGWTHKSLARNNTINPDRITQIPLTKVDTRGTGVSYVNDPGFIGGALLQRTDHGSLGVLRVQFPLHLRQQYRIRVRYASTTNIRLSVNGSFGTISQNLPSTMRLGEDLRYGSFAIREFNTSIRPTASPDQIRLTIEPSFIRQEVYVDRIEFIPVNPTREAKEDLEAAKKAVASLFTRTRDGLQVNVKDYQVDQAANLVSCLSDEQYGYDKKMLLEAVRAAKRLSRERNLLQDPDFNTINSTEENGWKASNGVTISEGGPFYKGRAIQLASARENYPTYIYQKVDASELKPYTRYRLDGFVKSSQDLEIDLIHHHKVHLVKNVPDNLVSDTYPDDSCSGINRCQEQQMVNAQLETEHHHPMDCCEAAQTHEFSSYIDTGDLNSSVDQGIWAIFKVRTTDGYATLGNLELVEVGPLSGESLEREQRDNTKWSAELGRKRAETDRVYQDAKQSINHLFVDYQDQQLNPEIGMADIMDAQNLVASISDVYSDAVLQIPGINYEIYTELSNRLQQASYLYTSRNAVQNGDFSNGLDSWNATAGASVQQDGNTHFLVLSHWDAQVSQQFRVQPNCKYVLRVTAEKVGGGDGYVTIRDDAHHTETLTFNACDYDINGTYVTDNTYLTKEVVFHPETQHMWVEVNETEGAFHIDSIEFVETEK